VWRRWKAGQALQEVGRAFDKEHSSIRCLVRVTVGLLRPPGGVRSSRSRHQVAMPYPCDEKHISHWHAGNYGKNELLPYFAREVL
jgi:hypothetical protein